MSWEFQKHVAFGFARIIHRVMFGDNFTIFLINFSNYTLEFFKPGFVDDWNSVHNDNAINTIRFWNFEIISEISTYHSQRLSKLQTLIRAINFVLSWYHGQLRSSIQTRVPRMKQDQLGKSDKIFLRNRIIKYSENGSRRIIIIMNKICPKKKTF